MGVAPWELDAAPVAWQDRASVVMDAEAERDRRDRPGRARKGR